MPSGFPNFGNLKGKALKLAEYKYKRAVKKSTADGARALGGRVKIGKMRPGIRESVAPTTFQQLQKLARNTSLKDPSNKALSKSIDSILAKKSASSVGSKVSGVLGKGVSTGAGLGVVGGAALAGASAIIRKKKQFDKETSSRTSDTVKRSDELIKLIRQRRKK